MVRPERYGVVNAAGCDGGGGGADATFVGVVVSFVDLLILSAYGSIAGGGVAPEEAAVPSLALLTNSTTLFFFPDRAKFIDLF